ncbi:RNA polymerase sigma factor [Brevibacillus sp. M2.1A]|uniref:RNA polymerase sigma factor n=1 Tax=Brevibacillus sp. M2.1A TaxID=2738980 RepID=UPI00156BC7FB|nr:RNA polymerase sigma factor [Brevibacillus sp. M2.1A]MCC8434938.1 RNA polymerase sigma factor [Brevibacillus sp. M2.1A]
MYEEMKHQVMTIYERHYHDVYQFLLYFAGSQNDAEDLTQEVFLRVIRSLERFEERSDVKTWLFAIAKHTAMNYYRKRKWQKLLSGDWLSVVMPASEGNPAQEAESREDEQELIDAIKGLPPHHRMVVILRGIKEYSVKETAEILGCSESNVKTTMHRALKLLHGKLSHTKKGELYSGLAK